MRLGKPVVASKVMAIPEIVMDEETGLLVPPEDSDALARVLLRLMDARSLCQQLGRAGRQRVEREFTIEVMVQKTIGVYQKVLGIPRSLSLVPTRDEQSTLEEANFPEAQMEICRCD